MAFSSPYFFEIVLQIDFVFSHFISIINFTSFLNVLMKI